MTGISGAAQAASAPRSAAVSYQPAHAIDSPQTRKAFAQFVGHTFYSQMLAAMRKTVDPPAYLHGGEAEDTYQMMLDQHWTEKLSAASQSRWIEPMYRQFLALGRR